MTRRLTYLPSLEPLCEEAKATPNPPEVLPAASTAAGGTWLAPKAAPDKQNQHTTVQHSTAHHSTAQHNN